MLLPFLLHTDTRATLTEATYSHLAVPLLRRQNILAPGGYSVGTVSTRPHWSPDARPRATTTARRLPDSKRRVKLKSVVLFFFIYHLIILMIKIHILILFFPLQVIVGKSV